MLAAWVAAASCMPAARVFLDIPEPTGQSRESDAELITMERLDSMLRSLQQPPEPPRPPIETFDLESEDSILALLPADSAGNVDWVQAWRVGTIRPRRSAPGLPADSSTGFMFDVYLRSAEGPEAFFPHSIHQEWISCQSCHPRIFRNGEAGGRSAVETHVEGSCATCHGPVAFPMETCERCHQGASGLPTQRSEKSLGATLAMRRGQQDGPDGVGSDLYQQARFPHGIHRLRFQCRACHQNPFVMESGSTVLYRDAAHSSQGCGRCHNGVVAFDTHVDACYRCHEEPRE